MPVRITHTPAGGSALPAQSLVALHARLDAEIAEIRRSVEAASYPVDPILGDHSRVSSMAAAYVRRHGMLAATCLGLCVELLSEGRLEVVPEFEVPLTRVARDIVRANSRSRTGDIDLPEGGVVEETCRLDHLIVSEELGVAWVTEVKRVNAELYHRKLRGPLRRLEIARLSAGAMLRGAYRISRVEPLLISLYGTSPSADILDRASIDAFFGLPIEAELDRLDERYRAAVTESLQARVQVDFGSAFHLASTGSAMTVDALAAMTTEPTPDPVPASPITPAALFAGPRSGTAMSSASRLQTLHGFAPPTGSNAATRLRGAA